MFQGGTVIMKDRKLKQCMSLWQPFFSSDIRDTLSSFWSHCNWFGDRIRLQVPNLHNELQQLDYMNGYMYQFSGPINGCHGDMPNSTILNSFVENLK